tara:strand:- start:4928 stop:6190 length:1263 start_codon:yes stop_codon:yes gene_type:complete
MLPTDTIEFAKHILGGFSVILGVGCLCGALSRKVGIPDIVLYLLAGMVLGSAGLGVLDISADSSVNQAILIFGASYLVFDGGASLRLQVLTKVWISISVLATFGLLITAAVTAAAAHYIAGIPVMVALLIGAAIASTDPATLVPIFKQVPIRERVAQTVMAESAFNDAMGAIITFTIAGLMMGAAAFSLPNTLADLAYTGGGGLLVGLLAGFTFIYLISPEKIGLFTGFAPVFKIVAILATYLGADAMGTSGFMAVFVLGIMVGNRRTFKAAFTDHDTESFESFQGIIAEIMRIMVFILLGSHVDFELINRYLFDGIIIVAVLMLVARPLTVFLCCLPDRRARWTLNEMLFMCWTRETGVIPAALAGLLVGMKVPGAKEVAATVFIAIIVTIVIQASSTKWLAGKLGLLEKNGSSGNKGK